MSPEQVLSTGLDPRADLYSLGVMLFEMLMGHLPFDQETAAALQQAHVFAAPKPPSQWVSWINRDLDAFVLQLLAKRPSQRPQSARDAQTTWRGLAVSPK